MSEDVQDDRPPTRALTEDECWQLIREAPYGRIAATAAGEIDIFPVNHGVHAGTVVFRTSPGTKLLELTIHHSIVFEVDGFDRNEAFSVVVKGDAVEIERSWAVEELDSLGLRSWAPEDKDRWVQITPRLISGRTFTLAPKM